MTEKPVMRPSTYLPRLIACLGALGGAQNRNGHLSSRSKDDTVSTLLAPLFQEQLGSKGMRGREIGRRKEAAFRIPDVPTLINKRKSQAELLQSCP